jgi:DNA polymerase I
LNILALDLETPMFSKKEPWRGNVYGDPRPPVCWSCATDEYGSRADLWTENTDIVIQELLDSYDLIVGFNFKHDVAYLRREGCNFSNVKVWDVQIAEFVLGRQLHKFPSLNDTAIRLALPTKLDVVKVEYWDKGVDTADIPWPILSEYAAGDAALTLACYHRQITELTPKQKVLVSLMSQDMLILQEMEATGITFDEEMCKASSKEIEHQIKMYTEELQAFYPNVPINFNSGDNLSAFLYGGTVYEDGKEHVGFYKSGLKAGQPKFKNTVIEHQLPRLFEPIKGSELAKEGYYETNEGVLKKLKGKNKSIIEKLLHLAKLEKMNGTYYLGLPKLNAEMHWPKGKLHGQFNQTLAATGRLSSSKPNQQNFASELQDIFVSTYE